MGMAARMMSEAVKVTNAKPVAFQHKDKDGDELQTSYTTTTAPRNYSRAEIERVAAIGVKVSASKKLETGVTMKMPRTEATGLNGIKLIGVVFDNVAGAPSSAAELLAAADELAEQHLLAELERETAPAA